MFGGVGGCGDISSLDLDLLWSWSWSRGRRECGDIGAGDQYWCGACGVSSVSCSWLCGCDDRQQSVCAVGLPCSSYFHVGSRGRVHLRF